MCSVWNQFLHPLFLGKLNKLHVTFSLSVLLSGLEKKKVLPLQSDIGSDRTAVHFLNFSTSYDHIFHEPAFKPVLNSYQTR